MSQLKYPEVHQLLYHLRLLPSDYRTAPEVNRKNGMVESLVHREPILGSDLEYLLHEVPQQAFVFFGDGEATDRLSYDDLLALEEVLIFLLSCEHFEQDNSTGPGILLLSEQVVVGLRGDEERLSGDHFVG